MTRTGLAEHHRARARAIEAQARALLDEAALLHATADALTISAQEDPCPAWMADERGAKAWSVVVRQEKHARGRPSMRVRSICRFSG